MQTESIKRMLSNLYGKDSYTEEELGAIDTLRINRLDFDDELMEVNFEEIKLFPNIKELYIENCIIDSNNIDYIVDNNFETLFLINCDVVEDISSSLGNLNDKNLVLDNVDIKLGVLNNVNFDRLTLKNIKIDQMVSINARYLDIQLCDVENLLFLENDFIDIIVVSFDLYNLNSNYFDNLDKKIIVMEDNGQFEYKRVGC